MKAVHDLNILIVLLQEKILEYSHPPSPETLVMVCGVPAFYEAVCGSRKDQALAEGSILQRLGYSADMVAKL